MGHGPQSCLPLREPFSLLREHAPTERLHGTPKHVGLADAAHPTQRELLRRRGRRRRERGAGWRRVAALS